MTFWRDDTRERDIYIDLYHRDETSSSLHGTYYYERVYYVSKHTATSAESSKIIKMREFPRRRRFSLVVWYNDK